LDSTTQAGATANHPQAVNIGVRLSRISTLRVIHQITSVQRRQPNAVANSEGAYIEMAGDLACSGAE